MSRSEPQPGPLERLRRLPDRTERLVLAGAFLLAVYALWALRYFPSHDCFNNYVGICQYVISSLLDGVLPTWDPMAACGAPIYLAAVMAGLLEPFFPLSVLAGKALGLNPLSVYFLWIVSRTIPFLAGTFALLKLLTRHSLVSLVSTLFLFGIFFAGQLRDHVFYAIYWPAALACLVRWRRSLLAGASDPRPFYGLVLTTALSLALYNPGYLAAFLLCMGTGWLIADGRKCFTFARSALRFPLRHWIAGALLGACVLAPLAVLYRDVDPENTLSFVRAHQAFLRTQVPFESASLSLLEADAADFIQVDPTLSPTRRLWESVTILPPFHYARLPHRMECHIYFGFLGISGIGAALFLRPNRPFRAWAIGALLCLVGMSPAVNPLLPLATAAIPPLRFLNQRHLLYPAFWILATLAAAGGLRLVLTPRLLRRVRFRVTAVHGILAGAAVLAAGLSLLVWQRMFFGSGVPSLNDKTRALCLFFLAVLGILTALSREGLMRPARQRTFLWTTLMIGALDLVFFLRILSEDFKINRGPLAATRMLREPTALEYRPDRTPLLPRIYDSPAHAIERHFNLRAPFPAYWHSSAVALGSRRLYDLVGALPESSLSPLLGISAPVARLVEHAIELAPGEDALVRLSALDPETLARTAVLELPGTAPGVADPVARAFATPARPAKEVNLPPAHDIREHLEKAFFSRFFDRRLEIDPAHAQEVTPGVYHRRLFRIPFPDLPLAPGSSESERAGRLFFPDFPSAIDLAGRLHYYSPDRRTALRAEPGFGLLLEWDGRGGGAALPRSVWVHDPPPPDPAVTPIAFGPNRAVFRVETPETAVLLYADAYDRYWKASIDGTKAPLWIANHAFKAVRVPAGSHEVAFAHEVPALRWGLIVWTGALAVGFLLTRPFGQRKTAP